MEDQDKRTEEQEDVEAHARRRPQVQASEGPEAEGESDDVEAHARRRPQVQASEGAPEAEGEDEDFELHKKSHKAL